MTVGAWVCLGFWTLVVALLAYDEARRERPPVDDSEARKAFNERIARELSGRDA